MYVKLIFLWIFLVVTFLTILYMALQFNSIVPQLLSNFEAAIMQIQYAQTLFR